MRFGLFLFGLCAALCSSRVHGALRAVPNSKLPAQKVRHLLIDMEESVKKAGEDADLTYATLDTYGQQLEMSLQGEIRALNVTLTKLLAVRQKYEAQINASDTELHHLGAAVQGSQEIASSYKTGTAKVGKKFDGLLVSVKALVALLQNAVITPDGTLITPEQPDAQGQPTQVFNAIRRLLSAHKNIANKYGDVFQAFQPEALLQTGQRTALQTLRSDAQAPAVRMTPALLSHTVGALKTIEGLLSNRKVEALGQFESRQEKYQSDATSTAANMNAQLGVQAENEEKAEDLSFSISFTQAVLKKDIDFHTKVTKNAQAKKRLVDDIVKLRTEQQATLKNLVDILDGKYSMPQAAPAKVAVARPAQSESHVDWLWQDHSRDTSPPAFLALSFLQTQGKPERGFSNLQTEIESTLQHHGDTHSILMRIKAMLDNDSTAQVDADNVKDVMAQMQDVLRAATEEQSKADEVKRRCNSQMYRAREESQGLKANVALMKTARDHTIAAIRAAKSNLKGISSKVDALQKSQKDFTQIDQTAKRTLEDQARDRGTIMVAVEKAGEVAKRAFPTDKTPAIVLLQQLLRELQAQELKERTYREEMATFKTGFIQYAQDYVALLNDRQSHYQNSLAVLELYANELGNDELSQSDSLESSDELKDENVELCNSVLKFYQEHDQRRQELISTLKAVLPRVPDILSMESDGDGGAPSDP